MKHAKYPSQLVVVVLAALVALFGGCRLTLDSNLEFTARPDARLHAEGSVEPYHYETWGYHGIRLGELINPTALTLDHRGNLYVLDSGNQRVQVINPRGEVTQAYDYNFGGGERSFRPDDLSVSRQGILYLADAAAGTVFKFEDVSTAVVVSETSINISGSGRLQRRDSTLQGAASAPSVPSSVSANWAGEFIVASGDEIWEFDHRGNFVNLYSLTGGAAGEVINLAVDYDRSIWALVRDGRVLHLDFRARLQNSFPTSAGEPMALACDGGMVAVADGYNNAFYLYHESGRELFSAVAATPEGVVLLNPSGIALDYENRRLYLSNTGAHAIEVFDLDIWEPAEVDMQ